MATINKLLMFRALSPEQTSWRGEVLTVDTALQQVKVKRGATFSMWIPTAMTLQVGDQVLVKNKAVISKLPLNVDYAELTL